MIGQELITQASQAITEILHKYKTLLYNIESIEITNEDQRANAEMLLKLVRDAWKEEDEDRQKHKKPFKEGGEAIDDIYRDHLKSLKDADVKLAKGLKDYQVKKMLESRAEEARLKKEAGEAQANGTSVISPSQVTVAPPPKTTKTALGATEYRDHYKATVIDFALLPAEYKIEIVDDAKLQKAVNGDNRLEEDHGCEISYDPIVATKQK